MHQDADRPTPQDVIALLLAAGEGSRFRASAGDAAAQKLLAALPDGRPVVLGAVAALQAVAARIIAVVRPGSAPLAALLAGAGCEVLEAPQAVQGMGASLAAGARHIISAGTAAGTILVALGDMPWIRPQTIQDLCDAARAHPIVAPVHAGRRGHPVAFDATMLPELTGLHGDAGARALLARHGLHELPCDDPAVLRDVDTVADLTAR